MKLNLDKLRNTLRTTLIDLWEYVIPIWKISGLFKSIKSKNDLENFIQERSAHVTQTTLYGYLKTRIGVKYIAMMEDERFLKSINLAKWNIYVVALADCAFYVFSYLVSEKNLKDNLIYYEKNRQIIQKAETTVNVLDSNTKYSLLELNPITGRKHQLRKQLAVRDCPIVGDNKYNVKYKNSNFKHLMLHAYSLKFKINERKYSYYISPDENFLNLLK